MLAGGLGMVVNVTTTGAEVAEQPELFITVTLYVPGVLTVIDCVVCPPGDHTYEVPPAAVSVTVSPGKSEVGPLALIVAVAADEITMFVGDDVFVHPELLVTLTV